MAMFRQAGIVRESSADAPMKEFLKSLLASVLGTFLAGALCAFLLCSSSPG